MDTGASARPTCGTLYRLFEEQCPSLEFLHPSAIPHGDVRLADRALGHMRGQAEKVYLGACSAFMIRPADDWFGWAVEAMMFTCRHYGLSLSLSTAAGEVWGYADSSLVQYILEAIATEPPTSPIWHHLRGALCGIPCANVDQEYHLRADWGTRCEPLNWLM